MRLWRRVYHERRAVMVPLVFLLVANTAVLALGVLPLVQSVKSLEAESEMAGTSLLKARLIEKQAKDALGSKERADQELRTFYAEVLPDTRSAAQKVISFLDRAASTAGLQFYSGQSDDVDVKDSQLARMSEKLVLVGDYASIRKFLYAVETAQEFVVIERVGLAQASDVRSANSGRLEVALDVTTYYLVNPATAR